MPSLCDRVNVADTAIVILIKKGYQVWFTPARDLYWAEKDGWDFASSSPVGLLGLVAVYEFHQPAEWADYWWRMPEAGLHRTLPSEPPSPYVPASLEYRNKPTP